MAIRHLYPLAAQTKASAIPVFPDDGSNRRVSESIRPSRLARATIDAAIRSFNDPVGRCHSAFP